MPRRIPKTDPRKAVGYIRVSTEDQHLGPTVQRSLLEQWSENNGVELIAIYEDLGVSGGAELDKRPALMTAMTSLEEHSAGVLLVAKRDRLARDVIIAAMIERLALRKGAQVVTADGTGNGNGPEGQLMRTMIDAFAQYERALIRSRTKTALAVKRSQGRRVGQVPYGYRLDSDGVHVVEKAEEQQTLRLVRDLRSDGLSVRAIARRLNEEGHPARGKRWYPTTVARLIERDPVR